VWFFSVLSNFLADGTTNSMRNVLGERVLGLSSGPNIDNALPWSQVPDFAAYRRVGFSKEWGPDLKIWELDADGNKDVRGQTGVFCGCRGVARALGHAQRSTRGQDHHDERARGDHHHDTPAADEHDGAAAAHAAAGVHAAG
jgi:hypothetical protein